VDINIVWPCIGKQRTLTPSVCAATVHKISRVRKPVIAYYGIAVFSKVHGPLLCGTRCIKNNEAFFVNVNGAAFFACLIGYHCNGAIY
jgi:hypothetical protein